MGKFLRREKEEQWNREAKITASDVFFSNTFLLLFPKCSRPNHLTIFRLISIPFVAYFFLFGSFLVGTILFFFSAFSDVLDGAMARTGKQITAWGVLFDPIADKFLIGITALILITKYINLTLVILLIGLEICVVVANAIRLKGRMAPARWTGKVKMGFESFGLVFLMIFVLGGGGVFLSVAQIFLYGALLFAFLSAFVYYSV